MKELKEEIMLINIDIYNLVAKGDYQKASDMRLILNTKIDKALKIWRQQQEKEVS